MRCFRNDRHHWHNRYNPHSLTTACRWLSKPALWLAVVFCAGLLWSFCELWQPSDSAMAAPHAVRKVEHPFDPDWPEISLMVAAKCAACHRAEAEVPDLSTYAALISAKTEDGEPLVTPGKPLESWLWEQVIWNHVAQKDSELPDSPAMPVDELEWLTKGQLATIERWIKNGALEYKLPETCSTRPLMEIDFPSAKECKICHPKQYTEWSRSMHAYAQHSPLYMAYNLTLHERTSGTIGTFCSRCHTPQGTALGEPGSLPNPRRSRISMEGVTCIVCHRVARPYYKSSTRRAVVHGRLQTGCMYGPFSDPVANKLKSHKASGLSHLKSPNFCGNCHDFVLPPGMRQEEALSEWQNSPAPKQGITCQHCHMGPIPGIAVRDHERPLGRAATVPDVDPELIPLRRLSNHSFAGPDYSMLPDTEFPYKLDWMYEVDYRDYDKLTPYQKSSLNVLRRKNRRQLRVADKLREQLIRNGARMEVCAPETAKAGSRIKVFVEIINLIIGHNFPTGITQERQPWIEIRLFDPYGEQVFVSGDLDKNGDLKDEHSREVEMGRIPYDRNLFYLQSKFSALTSKGTERPIIINVNRHFSPVTLIRPATGISASYGRPLSLRVAKASIPPLGRVGKTYRIRLPKCPGDYVLQIKFNFRNVPPHLAHKIGTPHLIHLVKNIVIQEHQSVIHVTPR